MSCVLPQLLHLVSPLSSTHPDEFVHGLTSSLVISFLKRDITLLNDVRVCNVHKPIFFLFFKAYLFNGGSLPSTVASESLLF